MIRYEKPEIKEPTFELNEFNEPLTVSGPDAWIRDVVSMALYEQGTFSEDPNAGAAMNYELYNFSEDSVRIIENRMTQCCDIYLSDVPIKELNVATYYWEDMNTTVLVLSVTFEYERDLVSYAAYISLIDHQLRYVVNQLYAK